MTAVLYERRSRYRVEMTRTPVIVQLFHNFADNLTNGLDSFDILLGLVV